MISYEKPGIRAHQQKQEDDYTLALLQHGGNVLKTRLTTLSSYLTYYAISNITCYSADALTSDWGTDFDVVVLAGNEPMTF